MGYERILDTETGDIYQTDNGFTDWYNGTRHQTISDDQYTDAVKGVYHLEQKKEDHSPFFVSFSVASSFVISSLMVSFLTFIFISFTSFVLSVSWWYVPSSST